MKKILDTTKEHSTWFTSSERENDVFSSDIPAGEYFQSCHVTILSSYPHTYAKIVSKPMPGQSGIVKIGVNWQCPKHSLIKYQLEVFSNDSIAALEPSLDTRRMTGFLPSKHGFHFDNCFKPTPTELNTPLGPIQIGDASNGLCGGMVFTALDYFQAGLSIPTEIDLPSNDLLYDYVVRRLVDSFDLPHGALQYLALMHPKYPDGCVVDKYGLLPIGRAWRMIRQEWPQIKAALDAGKPCPLGLITVKSADIKKLKENHQVLAYGYDLVGDDLTLYIYDPNFHGDDNVNMKLNISDPEHPVKVVYNPKRTVFCFFKTNYKPSMPPDKQTLPGRIILFEDKNFGGKSMEIQRGAPNLSEYKEINFNDRISSFVIVDGNWSFYRNTQFNEPFFHGNKPMVLKPGAYSWVEDLGIKDDEISSLKVVQDSPNYKRKWIFF
jgi:hypothetical protein